MKISESVKRKLHEHQNGKCAICQQDSVILDVVRKYKYSETGNFDISNLMLLCPNCNHQIDFKDFREIDLVNYIALLMSQHPDFKNVKKEVELSENSLLRADIQAAYKNGNTLIIEVKTMPAYAPSRMEGLLITLSSYKSLLPNAQVVFAFPGLFSQSLLDRFSSEGIEVWDQKVISSKFKQQIINNPHPYFSQLFTTPISTTEEEKLLYELIHTTPGKSDWSKYESLITRILDLLFSKNLSSPITNRPTASKINRRDIILPNYCETGFWLFLRHRYKADYIVVDAKNYVGLVGKSDILQIANYLKQHGTGLFGIIITRKGEDAASLETRKEQWINDKKLIIILNDEEVKTMLSSSHPEEIIKQKIEDFRLDL